MELKQVVGDGGAVGRAAAAAGSVKSAQRLRQRGGKLLAGLRVGRAPGAGFGAAPGSGRGLFLKTLSIRLAARFFTEWSGSGAGPWEPRTRESPTITDVSWPRISSCEHMLLEKLGSFLHHCAKTKAFQLGISLHASAVKTGRQSEVFIGNHVLNFYAKCDCVDSAMRVFEEMPLRNSVTWSALISGFDQSNRPHLAIQLFSQMQKYFKPNEFVFASALSSCSGIKDSKLGQQIHAQALKLSHASVSFVLNSLILMYMKCGMCAHALLIFTDSECDFLTLVSYNIAITGLVENKEHRKGIEMFMIMCRRGLVPDRFTFAGLLGAGEVIYDLPVVMQLHCQMVKVGLDYTAFSGNVLMTLYPKFDLMAEMEKVFAMIEDKDVYSWNTALAACCRSEDNLKALCIFREMNGRDTGHAQNLESGERRRFAVLLIYSAADTHPTMYKGREPSPLKRGH
ncbi:Pentatricopeptide repeat-containing protein, mitochondrial [Sesamum alatum]|uniref:Pentatricopeptide repeat-containing protein, mitochondrial n=1 Tax=Sesamum alatum TaxID=300844 RepID=A0AAE2CAE5_9LAMI|nr:Pentatricopeptide repeat-containing protein, mitochondrial [Sesamum alatum]